MDFIRIIIAILLPPLGVFLQVGFGGAFWLNILLTCWDTFQGSCTRYTSSPSAEAPGVEDMPVFHPRNSHQFRS